MILISVKQIYDTSILIKLKRDKKYYIKYDLTTSFFFFFFFTKYVSYTNLTLVLHTLLIKSSCVATSVYFNKRLSYLPNKFRCSVIYKICKLHLIYFTDDKKNFYGCWSFVAKLTRSGSIGSFLMSISIILFPGPSLCQRRT